MEHSCLVIVLVPVVAVESPCLLDMDGGGGMTMTYFHSNLILLLFNSLSKEKLGVKVVSDSLVNEIMRGIRANLETLLPDVGADGVRYA